MKYLRLVCLNLLALTLVACAESKGWLEGDEIGREIASIQPLSADLDPA
ncbi:MAG: hypothetical protein HQ519_18845 [Planctomycetes bacterium]|nr:hypothetical protein [Planctomycetota bacterium]